MYEQSDYNFYQRFDNDKLEQIADEYLYSSPLTNEKLSVYYACRAIIRDRKNNIIK